MKTGCVADLYRFDPKSYGFGFNFADDEDELFDVFIYNDYGLIVKEDSVYIHVTEDELIDMVYAIVKRGMTNYVQQYVGHRSEVVSRILCLNEDFARSQKQVTEDKIRRSNGHLAGNNRYHEEQLVLYNLYEQLHKLDIPSRVQRSEILFFKEKTRKKIGTD